LFTVCLHFHNKKMKKHSTGSCSSSIYYIILYYNNKPRPTNKPSNKPSDKPTDKPAATPIDKPSKKPSDKPTDKPTATPIYKLSSDRPTSNPTLPLEQTSIEPTLERTTFAPTASFTDIKLYIIVPGLTSLPFLETTLTYTAYVLLFGTKDNAVGRNNENEISVRHFIRRNLQNVVTDKPNKGENNANDDDKTTRPSTADNDPDVDKKTPEVQTPDEVTPSFIPGTSEYDQNIVKIKSEAIPSTCNNDYGTNIPAGSACIEVFMTIGSAVPSADLSKADFNQIGADITSTIESGLFTKTLAIGGLENVTVIIPPPAAFATDAPSSVPTELVVVSTLAPSVDGEPITGSPAMIVVVTNKPTEVSVRTSSEPTTSDEPTSDDATKAAETADPCPNLSDCESCVSSAACLWCRDDGDGKCFNASPDIAESSRTNALNVSLSEDEEDAAEKSAVLADEAICSSTGTIILTCNLPTDPPFIVPTTAPSALPPAVVEARPAAAGGTTSPDSGSSYLSSNNVLINTIMSGIWITMLLLYRQ
jgi:hypothetical protein